MSRFIPQEIIREIQDKADIHEVISGYLPLKKSGNRWKGLCPFHQEKTPSFFVNTEAQAFHCFGCGKGGNAFSFIMEKENVDFLEAAHMLADRYGIFIPETKDIGPEDRKNIDRKERLYNLHALMCELYSKHLLSENGRQGFEYLKNRGITTEIIKRFQLGFAPDSWDYMIKQANVYDYTEEELIASGLVVKKEDSSRIYDRFRNRIIFPIWNEREKIIAFSARTIEADPKGGKYVNSPETSIFKKSRVLYALPFARKNFHEKKSAILCEGQIDVIAMHRAGFNNTIAPQGTAFTEEQANLLKRYTHTVYICFDGDTAGVNATIKAIDILLPLDFEVKVISLPPGQDPDTIYNQHGKSKLEDYVENALDSFTFLFNFFLEDKDIHNPHVKNTIIQKILSIICKINNSILRTSYASLLARELSLPETAVFAELNKLLRTKNTYNKIEEKKPHKQAINIPVELPINKTVKKAEEELLELAILHGDIGRRLEEELPHELISNTSIGKALNLVISLTINGEWENIKNELNLLLHETSDKTISKILTAPTEYPEKLDYTKAVTDCINKIKKHSISDKISLLMRELHQVSDTEQKSNLLKKITELQKEKIQL